MDHLQKQQQTQINMKNNKKKKIYFSDVIIDAIHRNSRNENHNDQEPCGSVIKYTPFPDYLRDVIDPFIEKSRKKRNEILELHHPKIKIKHLLESGIAQESDFSFDTKKYPILPLFLRACGFADDNFSDDILENLHQNNENKDNMMKFLTDPQNIDQRNRFQSTYDSLVREVAIPKLVSIWNEYCDVQKSAETPPIHCNEVFYQSFPCLRIIRPNEFSIGPHCDIQYDHSIATINFYIPLTSIGNSNSLFLESLPGLEDWHPIEGKYGNIKRFAGGINMHWTALNLTNTTRVSLDFRIILGPLYYDQLVRRRYNTNGNSDEIASSYLIQQKGYYSRAVLSSTPSSSSCPPDNHHSTKIWKRDHLYMPPDARMGYPWTKVKRKSGHNIALDKKA